MFSKVSRRRRSSAPELSIPVRPEVPTVDVAPALVRWDDFSRPFPPVSPGGYTRYYRTRMTDPNDFSSSPPATPFLSQSPEPSPTRTRPQRPIQSPLFPLSLSQQKRCLSIIRESSAESMNLKKPFFLTISTSPPPTPASLRRRKRRLLRTPSIERDFAIQARQLFGSITPINGWSHETGISPLNRSMSQSSSYDSHDSRGYSLSSPSDSGHAEFPLTPATSVDDEEDRDEVVFTNPWAVVAEEKKTACAVNSEPTKRPASRAESFSTAKSSLSEG
ncbi:hypothetical protein CVT24_003108 [Panaeolus cyanescens]|uniref:Uncharacterized protein n=1 Tax=Panaeolus cyanescens TaxID=181874 RepID=A0A409YXV4_9AGAR|nr:hypothetical protein CVT24_003108 [Panaeolus cyanescens]